MQEQLWEEIRDELRRLNLAMEAIQQKLSEPIIVTVKQPGYDWEKIREYLRHEIFKGKSPPDTSPAPASTTPPPKGPAAPLAAEPLLLAAAGE